ncbi:MAG: MFS transporter [Candidatus Omnitrophica bacterium]|nr:MFS transporter [Candidatus Omnitrophota bacterium]
MESQKSVLPKKEMSKKMAFQCIILLGIVSLFGDITYEGARGITGPYLALLGASAAVVGVVSGIGEFLGYTLRFISGYLADRTKSYWTMTILGYALIFAIPLLGFTDYWQVAAILIILERVGKAIRSPARDTILSHATKQVGRGLGFGLHEALDQVGAIIGALIFSFVLLFKDKYQTGFVILCIPAILTMAFLILAKAKYPSMEEFEAPGKSEERNVRGKLPNIFWVYTFFIFLAVGGFANFQLISYHFKAQAIIKDYQIPMLYAVAMAVDGAVALIIGRIYDKVGLKSLLTIPLLTIFIPFFAFSHNYSFVVISIVLWGAVMGIHETIMRAAIADMVVVEQRGFAYGVFNTIYGASWFFGGAVMGFLYGFSPVYIMIFAAVVEVASVTLFILSRNTIFTAKKI